MELRHLRYLRSVVRLGGVGRAAEHEHVSQPSISKQLRLLEREVGVRLFDRAGRNLVPTRAALLLAEAAERILDDLATTLSAARSLGEGLRGELRICATETVTGSLLPSVLAGLRERGPELQLMVEMHGTDEAVQRLLADEFDIAVVVLPLADSRLEQGVVFEEAIRLVAPASHPWAGRGTVALTDALTEPSLLLSMHGRGLRALLEREAQARGLTLHSPVEMRSQQALLGLVAAGAGICFAPVLSLGSGGKGMVALALEPPLTRQIGWAVRRGRYLSPAGRTFLDLLQQHAAGLDTLSRA